MKALYEVLILLDRKTFFHASSCNNCLNSLILTLVKNIFFLHIDLIMGYIPSGISLELNYLNILNQCSSNICHINHYYYRYINKRVSFPR
jgi:uncharacterized membrane protein YGL010W